MANNTRAMRMKANAEEYDQKLSDIKRLTRGLEKLVNEVMGDVASRSEYQKFAVTRSVDDDLRIIAQFYWSNPSPKMQFDLWKEDIQLNRDTQFDLSIARCVHSNLDVLIEMAESICENAGLLAEFKAKLARFE